MLWLIKNLFENDAAYFIADTLALFKMTIIFLTNKKILQQFRNTLFSLMQNENKKTN
jgi:hypothetical protein